MTFTRRSALFGGAAALSMTAMSGLPAWAQEAEGIQDMVIGADDAPITMIEYASYTCPHCATFHNGVFKQIKADYIDTGKVKFIYREVYFDRYGLWASMVARCGGAEKFFGISDLLYKGQSTWARAEGAAGVAGELRKIGLIAGLNGDDLDACMQDEATAKALVGWYQENAERDGIRSTPSFIVNGQSVPNQNYDDFKALFDAELAG